MALTDAKIRNTKPGPKPIKLTDSGGLYLLVKPTDKKLWRYRYRIEKRCDGWSDYYHSQVRRALKANVYPSVGDMPIKDVTAAHLLVILQRVEGRGAKTMALLIRQWCSAIFRYAVSTLRADSDPAAALKGAVTRPKVEHSKPLSRDEIPDLLKKLDGYSGYRTTNIALRLLLLTFVRTKELRGANWSEFDLDGAEWRIPAPDDAGLGRPDRHPAGWRRESCTRVVR